MFSMLNVLSMNIATTADNYIYKAGSFVIEIRFQYKWLVEIFQFKEFSFYNIIATKATFSLFSWFESWFITWLSFTIN